MLVALVFMIGFVAITFAYDIDATFSNLVRRMYRYCLSANCYVGSRGGFLLPSYVELDILS